MKTIYTRRYDEKTFVIVAFDFDMEMYFWYSVENNAYNGIVDSFFYSDNLFHNVDSAFSDAFRRLKIEVKL